MTLLTTSSAVAEFCEVARNQDFITIDTEFLRESTYWPKLCLIQVGLKDQAVAIDPLIEGIDLSPIWGLIGDESVLKVFHACKQDMELFLKVSGKLPRPIFDTQIAAMMLGYGEQIGYDNLIQRVLGKQIDKTSQYSDWTLRPLDEQQLSYALGDVTYLYEAYEEISSELELKGRRFWVEEELEPLQDPSLYRVDPKTAWQRLKVKNRTKPFLAALACLADWREQFAQHRDLPRNRILKDETLIDLAMRRPKSAEAMVKLRGIGEGLARGKTGASILKALTKASTLSDHEVPVIAPRPHPIPGAAARAEMLRTLLKVCADKANIAPRALATSSDIEALARDSAADLPCMNGWRLDLFGEQAQALLKGDLWLGLTDGELAVLSSKDIASLA